MRFACRPGLISAAQPTRKWRWPSSPTLCSAERLESSLRPFRWILPQVETAIDPICGMTVDAVDTSHPLDVGDMTYYFCCPGCRAAFGSQQGV